MDGIGIRKYQIGERGTTGPSKMIKNIFCEVWKEQDSSSSTHPGTAVMGEASLKPPPF